MEYVPCIGNSSYSFWRILLKLYRCFKDGLEICILFFQNPEIIFYHFFRIFNLDIFRALILQICIWSIYLVSATPLTVFGESFWNFTVVFKMVWRYAYCFLRILKLFFLHFNLDIFSSLYATDMYREYMPCIGNPAYSFRPILLKLYRYFAAFLWFRMRNLSLAGYNCSGGASCMACSFILLVEMQVFSSFGAFPFKIAALISSYMLFYIFWTRKETVYFMQLYSFCIPYCAYKVGLTTSYCNDPKFSYRQAWQAVQTQIRLLLEKQSDQGLHCLQFPLHLLDALL